MLVGLIFRDDNQNAVSIFEHFMSLNKLTCKTLTDSQEKYLRTSEQRRSNHYVDRYDDPVYVNVRHFSDLHYILAESGGMVISLGRDNVILEETAFRKPNGDRSYRERTFEFVLEYYKGRKGEGPVLGFFGLSHRHEVNPKAHNIVNIPCIDDVSGTIRDIEKHYSDWKREKEILEERNIRHFENMPGYLPHF